MDSFGTVRGYADTLEVGLVIEKTAQPLSKGGMVVSDEQPDLVRGSVLSRTQ